MRNNISMSMLGKLYKSGKISPDQLTDYINRLETGLKISNQTLHSQIVAIKAASIAGSTMGAENGMIWLNNYLWGPGLLPTDEELEMGAEGFLVAKDE